jgi:hypothetical protein
VGGLAFALGPHRVVLSRQDVSDLDGWFWSDRLGRQRLGGPLKHAIESGADLIVDEDQVRITLLEILDAMDGGGFVYTPGMRRLHDVARRPMIRESGPSSF